MGAPVKGAVPAKPRPASPAEEAAAVDARDPVLGWENIEIGASSNKEISEDKNLEKESSCIESLRYGSDDVASLPAWSYSTEQASSCGSELVSEVGEEELSENCNDETDALRTDSTVELLPPVGTATLSKTRRCVACDRDASANLCYKCSAQLRRGLQESLKRPLGTGRFSYCLKCQSLVEGPHDIHKEESIVFGTFQGCQVAWVRKERWSCIFSDIQSDYWDRFNGRPILLHKPAGLRCKYCQDILADETLYGMLASFCTIECWLQSSRAAKEYDWVNNLVGANFDRSPQPPFDSFCVTCSFPFSFVEEGAEHSHKNTHQCLKVVTDFVGGAAKVEIARNHFMARPWTCIKDLAGDDFLCSINHLFRLRDERARRCRICRVRLEDGGGSQCSLDCSLSAPMVPRPLKLEELSNSTATEVLEHSGVDAP